MSNPPSLSPSIRKYDTTRPFPRKAASIFTGLAKDCVTLSLSVHDCDNPS